MENKYVLNGGPIRDYMFKVAWKHANNRIGQNDNLVAIPDIESGYPIIMTKKDHSDYLNMLDQLMPKIQSDILSSGKIVFFGTGESLEKNFDFNNLYDGE